MIIRIVDRENVDEEYSELICKEVELSFGDNEVQEIDSNIENELRVFHHDKNDIENEYINIDDVVNIDNKIYNNIIKVDDIINCNNKYVTSEHKLNKNMQQYILSHKYIGYSMLIKNNKLSNNKNKKRSKQKINNKRHIINNDKQKINCIDKNNMK